MTYKLDYAEAKRALSSRLEEKRAWLRSQVTEKFKTNKRNIAADIKAAVEASPICGTGPNQHNVRPTFSGVRDSLAWEVLLALLVEHVNWGDVLKAIKAPAAFSRVDASSKSGFAFGWPDRLGPGSVARIVDDINSHTTTEPMIEKPNLSDASAGEATDCFDALVRKMLRSIMSQRIAEGHEGKIDADDIKAAKAAVLDQFRNAWGDDTKSVAGIVKLREEGGKDPDYLEDAEEPSGEIAQRIMKYVTETYGEAYKMADAATATEAPAPSAERITIDKGFAVGINAMLGQATSGKWTDINQLFDALAKSGEIITVKEREVNELRRKLASVPTTPTTVTASASGAYPSGKVVWRNANEVFPAPTGKKQKLLDFDVPTFEWDGPHPLVPIKDENYKFKPGKLASLLWAIARNKKVWMHGHTGTGKSTLVEQVCARLSYPMVRINFDSEITRMDLLGRDVLKNESGVTKSEFVEGIVVQAMQQPCLLLCDEIDFIRPDVAYVFQRMLEDKGLLLAEDGGRLIVPNPMFRVVATANTQGQGDEFGAYQGARPQSQALLDRFTTWIEVEYLKKEEEAKLLQELVPALSADMAEQITNFATEVRQGFIQGDTCQTVSPRGLAALAEAVVHFLPLTPKPKDAVEFALDMTILSKATKQDRARINEYVNRTFK
jgi:cobaltochelatase CobS